MLGGTFFIALQSVIFVTALGIYRQATAANVIYSSRGLWSVVLVWAIGHWFHSQERKLGGSVLRWRLAGAFLMTAAILLVLL